jgi:hypothetical protein
MTEMQEGAPRGAFLQSSVMYSYSGAPMHLCSGVDSLPIFAAGKANENGTATNVRPFALDRKEQFIDRVAHPNSSGQLPTCGPL